MGERNARKRKLDVNRMADSDGFTLVTGRRAAKTTKNCAASSAKQAKRDAKASKGGSVTAESEHTEDQDIPTSTEVQSVLDALQKAKQVFKHSSMRAYELVVGFSTTDAGSSCLPCWLSFFFPRSLLSHGQTASFEFRVLCLLQRSSPAQQSMRDCMDYLFLPRG
jgi:hypothetical protein